MWDRKAIVLRQGQTELSVFCSSSEGIGTVALWAKHYELCKAILKNLKNYAEYSKFKNWIVMKLKMISKNSLIIAIMKPLFENFKNIDERYSWNLFMKKSKMLIIDIHKVLWKMKAIHGIFFENFKKIDERYSWNLFLKNSKMVVIDIQKPFFLTKLI